jgi:hypothetical protein
MPMQLICLFGWHNHSNLHTQPMSAREYPSNFLSRLLTSAFIHFADTNTVLYHRDDVRVYGVFRHSGCTHPRITASWEFCTEWPQAASVKRDHRAIVSITCHLSRVKSPSYETCQTPYGLDPGYQKYIVPHSSETLLELFHSLSFAFVPVDQNFHFWRLLARCVPRLRTRDLRWYQLISRAALVSQTIIQIHVGSQQDVLRILRRDVTTPTLTLDLSVVHECLVNHPDIT